MGFQPDFESALESLFLGGTGVPPVFYTLLRHSILSTHPDERSQEEESSWGLGS
jgi:hypothetical protein